MRIPSLLLKKIIFLSNIFLPMQKIMRGIENLNPSHPKSDPKSLISGTYISIVTFFSIESLCTHT